MEADSKEEKGREKTNRVMRSLRREMLDGMLVILRLSHELQTKRQDV